MIEKGEQVVVFLGLLKAHRDNSRRLFEAVEQYPDMLIAYVDSLPFNWRDTNEYSDLLIRLYERALFCKAG